jgi:hypothetical protein
MLDPGLLELKGARPAGEDKYTSLATIKFFAGLQTQRSVFAPLDTRYGTRFLGGKPDALLTGSNVEISNKATMQRRPGLLAYGTSSIPAPLAFFSWEQVAPFGISLIVDTASAIYQYSPTNSGIYLNKAAGSGQTNFLTLINTVYFGDGVDLFKLVGPNLLTWSNDLTKSANWTLTNATVTGGFTDPNGGTAAQQISWSSTGEGASIVQSFTPNYTPVASNTFTFSVWLKQNAGAINVNLEIDDQSAVIVDTQQTTTGTWAKYQVSGTMGGGSTSIKAIIDSPTSATTILVYGAQFEVGGPASPTQISTIKPQGVYLWGIVGPINAPAIAYTPGVGSPGLTITSISQPGAISSPNIISAGHFPNPNPNANLADWNGNTFPPASFGFFPGVLFTIAGATPSGYNSVGNLVTTVIASGQGLTPPFQGVYYTPTTNLASDSGTGTLQSQLVTVVVSSPHGLVPGNTVTISGTGVAAYNVTTTVFSVTSPTSFTFNAASAGNASSSTGTVTGSGIANTSNGLSPATGYTYGFAYLNSVTGQPSNLSPTVSTGKQTNVLVTLSGPGSADPQVDQIAIYRNTDGGAFLFQLATIPNPGGSGTWQYTDMLVGIGASPDANLNTQIYAPIGLLNTPPPGTGAVTAGLGALDPVQHASRTWVHVGTTLFYSAGPDNAKILNTVFNGVSAESFPPLNNIPLDAPIIRKISTQAGLLVWTTRDMWIVTGTDLNSFFATKILPKHGIRSWNALDIDGGNFYLYMSDRQYLTINPSTGSMEWGFVVGDLLEGTVDPTKVYVARHIAGSQDNAVYVADGSTGWFRMNPNQPGASLSGEQVEAWSPFASFVATIGGIGAVMSIETTPGQYQLLVGQTTTGPVLVRSITTFTDNGVAYTWNATIGSMILATTGQLAETESVSTEMTGVSTQATVAVLLDEISGPFETLTNSVNDPPQLATSASLLSVRFYLSQGATPPVCRHMQVKLSGAAVNTKDELLSLSIRGALVPEQT